MIKKFIFMMVISFTMLLSSNAQIAIEKSKLLDNMSIGVTVGASSPLDMNSFMPVNTNFGVKVQKNLTPIFGLQAEGLAVVNDNHFSDLGTWVKAINVNLNGVTNWSNLLLGYKGSPRTFEVNTVTGLGLLHRYNTNANTLAAKTGFDLAFNLGNKKAHSIVLTPAVLWNLSETDKIQFNKKHAQLALNVAYVYHFKNSNGTHSFKTYDIGALNAAINSLKSENSDLKSLASSLRDKNSTLNKAINELNGKCAELSDNVLWAVQFKQGSSELTQDAKATLDKVVKLNSAVDLVGTASPEGGKYINDTLSRSRADAVAKYLTDNGVTVKNTVGLGAATEASNRLVLVTLSK